MANTKAVKKVAKSNTANKTKKVCTAQSVKEAIEKVTSKNNNKVIIANWKMNKKFEDIQAYAYVFNKLLKRDKFLAKTKTLIGVAPTMLGMLPAAAMLKNNVVVVAQHVHYEKSGAFTGNVSYDQIHEYNINYSLIGHSETRSMMNVTEGQINKTIKVMLENQMVPVLCIGETLEQYEAKQTGKTISLQIMNALKGVSSENAKKVIIAYEPIWAIGAQTATVPVIKSVIDKIRECLSDMYDEQTAKEVHVLYGGSVKSSNANEILSINGVDGVLVGGAGLLPEEFYKICIASPEYSEVKKIILTKNGTKPLPSPKEVKTK